MYVEPATSLMLTLTIMYMILFHVVDSTYILKNFLGLN